MTTVLSNRFGNSPQNYVLNRPERAKIYQAVLTGGAAHDVSSLPGPIAVFNTGGVRFYVSYEGDTPVIPSASGYNGFHDSPITSDVNNVTSIKVVAVADCTLTITFYDYEPE